MITDEPTPPPIDWHAHGSSHLSADGRYFIAPAGFGAYVAHRRQLPQSRELGIAASLAAAQALCERDAQGR